MKRWSHEGRTLADYARSNGLKIHKFYAWKATLEVRGLWRKETSVSFLPVTVLDALVSDSGIRLKWPNSMVLEFTSNPDPAYLMNLLKLAVARP
ncbi:MAG: IS66 family insertion sequence element accessory protein TnpA [Acidiferrobacterales bacterium]